MIEVKVSKDGMMAQVSVVPEPGEELTEGIIEDNLRMEGVQVGINRAAISDILKRQIFDEFVEVARGKQPVRGKDGYYEYFFTIDTDNGRPRVREDGSVDYSRVIANVKEGDLLAEYHPSTNGTFGYTIFAKAIPPVKGKPMVPLRCMNVRQEENRYYAEKNGSASLSDNILSVQNILDIKGDANYSSGDIQFNGDIHVSGNIVSGVTIWAEGSVIVDGVIEDARVYAEQDIIVSRGIHGQGTHKDGELVADDFLMVEAKGNLKSRFIDHAYVRAGGEVLVDYAIGSILEAGGKVIAKGMKGIIVGGSTSALMGVEADYLGNDAELLTEVRVGEDMHTGRKKDPAGQQQWAMEQVIKQGRLSPIIVHKMIYQNVKMLIGEVYVPNMAGKYGVEFRKINGRIICKPVGSFTDAEIFSGVLDVNAMMVAEEKTRVLVIDDDSRLLRTVHRILEEDYQVAVAKSGNAARKYLDKNFVELILLDYMMPGENGVEVLNSLRAWDKTKDIPVVFLTGIDDKKKIIECLSLRPAGYILKPVDREKLLEKIRAIMGEK